MVPQFSLRGGISIIGMMLRSRGLPKDQESDLLDTECDTPFYEKTENLTSLIADYARRNRDSLLA